MSKNKTKDYTRKAIDKYNASKDRFTLTMDKGTKEEITRLTGFEKPSQWIVKVINEQLEILRNEKADKN